MIRSMLAKDSVFHDAGEMAWRDPSSLEKLPDLAKEHPRKIVVANPKFGMGFGLDARAAAIRANPDAVVLITHRRDLLAQAASWDFAALNDAFETAAVTKRPVAMNPATDGRFMFQCAMQLRQLRIYLASIPTRELAYEDISVATVKEAVEALLERSVKVGEPTTKKSAPERLEDFVTNLSDLKG